MLEQKAAQDAELNLRKNDLYEEFKHIVSGTVPEGAVGGEIVSFNDPRGAFPKYSTPIKHPDVRTGKTDENLCSRQSAPQSVPCTSAKTTGASSAADVE